MRDYEIETPDGKTIVVEGPEDATDDELIAFAQAELKRRRPKERFARPVVQRPSVKAATVPESGLNLDPKRRAVQDILASQQATSGDAGFKDILNNSALLTLGDEINGGAAAIGNILTSPFTGNLNPSQAYYDQRDADRIRLDQAREKAPVQSIFGDVLGGFVTGGNVMRAAQAAPTVLRSLGTAARDGAIVGGLTGFGSGKDTETSLVGGVLGGMFGGVLGGAVPIAATAGQRILQGGRRLFGSEQPQLARQIVGDALRADGNTGGGAGATMDAAGVLGVPRMLADTGENARSLLASVSRQPGPARTLARDAVIGRQQDQANRVRGFIERDLGQITNTPVQAQALREQARAEAELAAASAADSVRGSVEGIGPTVDRLASGGAARESFDTAYQAAKRRTNEAYSAPELTNPQPIEIPGELFARDLRSAADAFYGDGGGTMPSEVAQIIDDMAAPGATTRTLTNIDRRLADFAGQARMSGSRSDAAFAERVRGDLQAFADRAAPAPYREALRNAKAVRAQQGEVFETRDLPRTFANDRYGNPLVGDTSVPGRLFRPGAPGGDTADSLIAAVGPERAEAAMREELRRVVEEAGGLSANTVRTLATRYGETLQRFPALAQQVDSLAAQVAAREAADAGLATAGRAGSTALEQGAAATRLSPNEIGRQVDGLDESGRALFAQGYRNSLADMVDGRVDDADKARALFGTPAKRDALRGLFGGDEMARFEATLGLERDANDTFRSIAMGSQTAERLAADAQSGDGGLIETATDAALQGAQGGIVPGILSLLRKARDAQKFQVGTAGNEVRKSIATYLTETDPAVLANIIEEANRAAQVVEGRRRNVLNGGALAGRSLAQGTVSALGNQ